MLHTCMVKGPSKYLKCLQIFSGLVITWLDFTPPTTLDWVFIRVGDMQLLAHIMVVLMLNL